MKPIEENQRSSDAQEFEHSLEQLEDIVKPVSPDHKRLPKTETTSAVKSKNNQQEDKIDEIDLAAWEDAVADIEKYLGEEAGDEVDEDTEEN